MATKPLPAEYFVGGVFSAAGSELLRSYTCVCCGHRSATWATFRAHRADCAARQQPRAADRSPPAALKALAAAVRAERVGAGSGGGGAGEPAGER